MKTRLTVAALLLTPPAFAAPLIGMEDYAHPNTLVDVGNGRKMNLFCRGSGSPTVVFDSGSGLAGWDWLRVQPVIASKTRACVYDRAGLGFSDVSTRPGTSANAMDDLHRLLSSAGIKPPYVLVGHSYGGMTVQLYAYTHPKEVAGLVLVDAGHEDETSRLNRVTGGLYEKLMGEYAKISQACTVTAQRGGLVPDSELYGQCVGEPPAMFKGSLAKAYLSKRASIAYWEANQSEEDHETISADQLRAVRKSFGNLPLGYLTRGKSPFQPPGKPQSELNKAAEREVNAMHDEIAKLSTRGSNRLVPGAGHSIHVDKPRAVIEATLDVLKQARSAPLAP